MARLGIRPRPPRGTTLAPAVLLWLAGAAERVAGVVIPYDAGRWALLTGGARLIPGLPDPRTAIHRRTCR